MINMNHSVACNRVSLRSYRLAAAVSASIAIMSPLIACGPAEQKGVVGAAAPNPVSQAGDLAKDHSYKKDLVEGWPADCAPSIETARNGATDTVLGAPFGSSVEQVRAILKCTGRDYLIVESTIDIGGTPRPLITADDGLDLVKLTFSGNPGEERLAVLSREREYGADETVPVDTLKQRIEARYGTFDELEPRKGVSVTYACTKSL